MIHNTLFKAGGVVWCGAVGYASEMRNFVRALDDGHNIARNLFSSINHCVASGWFFCLHISGLDILK